MTEAQIDQLRKTLHAGKFQPDKQQHEYPFQRGWNAGIEYAETHLDSILKLKESASDA